MPGVPNASIARQVERAGFNAVYISGAGLANCTAGLPDIGLLTLSEVALLAGFVAKAVKIPAIVDATQDLVARKTQRARSANWKARVWPAVIWRIRNFPNGADISRENR